MKREILTLGAVLLLAAAPAHADGQAGKTANGAQAADNGAEVASEPTAPSGLYDFKGVALGTSLEDFRRMPHPDGKAARVVCTGEKVEIMRNLRQEPIAVMVFGETEKALGVKQCVWISLGGPFGAGSTEALSLAGSGYASYSYTFSFIPDPNDGVMRLYRYSGSTNVAAYRAIVNALSEKWGAPVITKETVQNRIGNSFDKETAVWDNKLSSIIVESRWSKVDDMNVVLMDTRLSKIVSDAESARRAAEPNAI